MAVAGMLAGLGGAVESLGVDGRFEAGVNVGLVKASLSLYLLAQIPLGVIPAALLVGLMEAGASRMQFKAGVAPELIDVYPVLRPAPSSFAGAANARRHPNSLQLGAGWGRS